MKGIKALTIVLAVAAITISSAFAAGADNELVLGENGKSDYRIVLPDTSPDQTIAECLRQTARVIVTAFEQNGIRLPVEQEKDHDGNAPGIFLGDTAFARANGVAASQLRDWNYRIKVVGPNVIIAGKDEPPPAADDALASQLNAFYRLGTLKGTLDFLRMYAGTYFLYPTNWNRNGLPSLRSRSVREWNLTETAGIEYLETPRIAVPSDLDLHKRFFIGFQKKTLSHADLYDVANNCFPPVADAALHHTYALAVPPEKYWEEHPEYFALVGGERIRSQYCISNEGFQEALYKWHSDVLAQGFDSIHILQPDGFRPCQCEECRKLYGTSDWGEKLWIFHRKLAERLREEHPDKKLVIHAYAVTDFPPKTFHSFPDNVCIYVQGTEFGSFDRWSEIDMPGGFYAGIHNWISNQTGRYVPMRTPLFVEGQVRNFYKHNVQGVNWDGRSYVYGLEGPVLYVYGRMFDDPESMQAKDLMREFCGVAFGKAAPDMLRFYDRLYHGIELYAFYLGTHGDGWTYTDIYGRRHKHLSNPFQLLGFLYTPELLEALEKDLSRAEKTTVADKPKARIALARREFDYIKSLANVVHLYQAYNVNPDQALRDRLLDAIDERNALIDGWYSYIAVRDKGRSRYDQPIPMPGWDMTLWPPPSGHNAADLRLARDGYQAPFKDTCLNWDTDAVRKSPLPGSKRMNVLLIEGTVGIDSPFWEKAESHELLPPPGQPKPERPTTVKVLCGPDNFYVLLRNELSPGQKDFPSVGEDGDLDGKESVEFYLAPLPGREVYYRFRASPDPKSWSDAANGLITDPQNLLYGRDDPEWDGKWSRDIRVDPDKNRWTAMLIIPIETLGAEPPAAGDFWRANFGRSHPTDNGIEKSFWSVSGQIKGVGDKNSLGDLIFTAKLESASEAIHPSRKWREDYYLRTFKIPPKWENLPNQLLQPFGQWLFRPDYMAKGVEEKWFAPDLEEAEWSKIHVPGSWKEVGFDLQGFAWYRVTFNLPAAWKGKTVRLLFAGVDEQAWVYVNGTLVREHTVESENTTVVNLWEMPFTADAKPEMLNYGAENVLAVRVKNDLGGGGIWRPVLVQAVEAQ